MQNDVRPNGSAGPSVSSRITHGWLPLLQVGEDLVGNSPPLFESWLVLEYCDQGTLQYALDRGKFDEGFIKSGKRNKLPHIYAVK